MATTYQTIPAEPTTAPEKSRKGLVFGVAAAAFLLGVAAATAVSTASKPTGASTAFSNAALHEQDLKSFKFYDHDDRFIDFPYLGDRSPLGKAVDL